MFFCFICDQKRQIESTKPAKGVCPFCHSTPADVKVSDTCRFCFIPLCWRSHHVIRCTTCGATLGKSN